jgi:putative tryptophan/tyrosine transport system substrate-binding protein
MTQCAAKQVELLQEAFPARNRLGVLWDSLSGEQMMAADRRAKAQGWELRALKLENPPYDFADAFRTLARDDVQMVLVAASPYFIRSAERIAALAIEHRLPVISIIKFYVEAGALMSYGVDFDWLMGRAASLVAKILRGAKPTDLRLNYRNVLSSWSISGRRKPLTSRCRPQSCCALTR